MPADNAFARLTADGTVVAEPTLTAAGDTPQPPPPMPEAATPAAPPPMPEAATPAPPPSMPEAGAPADPNKPAESGQATTTAAPTPDGPADGWQVDLWELRSFSDAVMRARSYLDAVQAKVDRMQGAELTPQIGTSPVGTQLAKKFDDRLNSAHGLRAMLAEAMKRMEDFVTSAETAARGYEDHEESTADSFSHHHHDAEPPPVKNG